MNNADMPAMPNELHKNRAMNGLTKREYFAGLAMQAMLSNEAALIRFNKCGDENLVDPEILIADAAIQTSDALLAELERTK